LNYHSYYEWCSEGESSVNCIRDVTPWNITSYKSMFNCIYFVIWLYAWLERVEVCLELVMCEFLDVNVELCGVLLS